MKEGLELVNEAITKSTTFDDLLNCLTPALSERLGGNKIGEIRAFNALCALASLRKRTFGFGNFRRSLDILEGEKLPSKKESERLLEALQSTGVIFGGKRGKTLIRRRFYRKLSCLYLEHCERVAQELEANWSDDLIDLFSNK